MLLPLGAVLVLTFMPAFAVADETPLTGIWRGTIPEISSPDPCKPWYFAEALIDLRGDGAGTIEFRAHGTAGADPSILIDIRVAKDGGYSGTYTEFDGTRDVYGKLDSAGASFTYHNPHGCSYGGVLKKVE